MDHKDDFLQALRNISRSKDGQILFETLEENYLRTSSLAETAELTYYNLGQRELIQHLLNLINEVEDIDVITIDGETNE